MYVPDLVVIHISQDLIISPAFHIIQTALLLNVLLNELWSADDDVSNALRHIHFFKRQYHLVTVVDNYFFLLFFFLFFFTTFSPLRRHNLRVLCPKKKQKSAAKQKHSKFTIWGETQIDNK